MNPENEARYGDAFCRSLIEGMYREALPLAWSNQKTRAEACVHEMKTRADLAASKILPVADAQEFVARFDRMRNVISDVMESGERAEFIESLGIAHLEPRQTAATTEKVNPNATW